MQTALFKEASLSKYVQRTEHGKNSFSSVFPFSNANLLVLGRQRELRLHLNLVAVFGSSISFK